MGIKKRQLGGLVVKSFACWAGGPGSIPGWGTQNFQTAFISKISASLSIACDVKPEGALYSVFYTEASKRTHTWELRVPCVDSQPYHLIITSACGSCSYKLIKLQSQEHWDMRHNWPIQMRIYIIGVREQFSLWGSVGPNENI